MAKVTSTFDGDAFRRRLVPKLKRQMQKAVIVIEREAIRLVTQKVYPPASIPRTPPAKRTGTLSRSMMTNVEADDDRVVGVVGNTKRYGRHLEMGTGPRKGTNHPGMAPRPYLRPAVTAMRSQAVKLLAEAFT